MLSDLIGGPLDRVGFGPPTRVVGSDSDLGVSESDSDSEPNLGSD